MNRTLFLPCEAGEGDHAQRGGGGDAVADVGARDAPSVTARIRAAPINAFAFKPPLRMGGRARIAGAVFAALALGGCVTLLPKTPPVQLYRFGAPLAATSTAPSLRPGGPARGVILTEVRLPRSAAGDGLLTVTGDQAAYIGGARWVEPAALLFQGDAEAAFAARAHNVLLLDRGQLSAASGVLRLDVSRFETRYTAGGAPTVVVRLRATLDRPDGHTVLAKEFTAGQAADADRISAIVAAYDAAVGQVLGQVVDWTDASAPALAAERPPQGVP